MTETGRPSTVPLFTLHGVVWRCWIVGPDGGGADYEWRAVDRPLSVTRLPSTRTVETEADGSESVTRTENWQASIAGTPLPGVEHSLRAAMYAAQTAHHRSKAA